MIEPPQTRASCHQKPNQDEKLALNDVVAAVPDLRLTGADVALKKQIGALSQMMSRVMHLRQALFLGMAVRTWKMTSIWSQVQRHGWELVLLLLLLLHRHAVICLSGDQMMPQAQTCGTK